MNVSVVIPVYNSGPILPDLVARLGPVLEAHYGAYELVFVNDGSRDDSWDVIQGLVRGSSWIRGVNLMRNYGQHNALLCGIRLARHEVVVTMDDDLQHPPEEIPKLTARLEEGFDVVYGPPLRQQHGLLRDMASFITKASIQATINVETARMVSAFRAFRTQVRNAFADYKGSFVSLDVLLTWGSTRFSAVPVRHDPRSQGESNYTLWKLVTHAANMITGFSPVPLQIASVLGFLFTLFGLVILIYVVANYLVHGGSVPGFSFLACIIAIFSGVQLLMLGVFGEYLARVHFRTMDRPSSSIREIIGPEGP
ncbi:MAG TPA: glycosyltransferase family 2 protein [Deltaproteobacteria bacterium]|nr:glycosyltransferase family 2 protein [Deltaproteobacteria bacterium]HQI82398.1 glycosyltransferase family 2 protein [Deltaproteobacteria bacterium]